MKPKFLVLLFVPTLLFTQQVYRSPYLTNPSLIIGYVDSCAMFWSKVYDAQYGGYFTNINRSGGNTNTAKHTMNQSRDAYGFVRAFQMTGKQIYLTYARQALQFMYAHSWDTINGGWYNTMDRYGNATAKIENKTAFYQHYALLGITAMFEVTRDSVDWEWLMKGYTNNETIFWDTRSKYFGYYDNVKYDNSVKSGKSFNATVDAITTHLLHLYLLTKDEKYLTRLKELADNMKNRLVASIPGQSIGFVEGYTADWAWNPSVTMTIMGHVLKTSWCFARLFHLTKDTAYLIAAEQLAQHVMTKGYDNQYGGPYKDYDRTTGQMLMWGITDTAKAWWQMEQAITTGMMLYQITGKLKYMTMADETLDFFMKYFVDHIYGDVYENRAKNGNAIAAWGTTKGNDGKAGYHSIETGYYTYLYQSLMIAKSTASLYYYFVPASVSKTYSLRPITFPDYRIKNAFLDDTLPILFDRNNSTVTLSEGKCGAVKVVFEYFKSATSVSDKQDLPNSVELFQNYPNPFNPLTTIQYTIPWSSKVMLNVYNILGQEIKCLVDAKQERGTYNITFNGRNLSSGVYFYQLKTGTTSIVKKMFIVK